MNPLSIILKQMFPVVLAAAMFGRLWAGKVIQFMVHNMVVVDVINATYGNDLNMMHLIRLLIFFASKYNFWFIAVHIPGRLHVAADALSRNNMSYVFHAGFSGGLSADCVAPALVSLLSQNITWTCKSWIKLFRDTLQQA